MNSTSPMVFRTNSYWSQDPIDPDLLPATPVQRISETIPEKLHRILEDWSLRIQTCADEAYDEGLSALESDLLDLRDEITYTLHQQLLGA